MISREPAYACLVTMIPTGTAITPELLKKAETAETALANLGFHDFRVRLMEDGGARLQITEEQMPLLFSKREEILTILRPFFSSILLDLEARAKSV